MPYPEPTELATNAVALPTVDTPSKWRNGVLTSDGFKVVTSATLASELPA